MLVGGKERVLVWCRTSSVIFLGREGSGGGWSYILSVLLLPAIGAGFGDRYSINLMSIGHYGVYSSGSGLSGLNISSKFFSDLRIGSIDGAFRSMKEGKEEGDFASVDGFFGYHYMPDRICHNVEGKSDPRADSSDSELYNRGSRPNADLGMTRDVQGGLHVPRDRDPPVVPHRFTLRSVITFIEGSVAGCAGAMFVYPIDLVKTRMQYERNNPGGTRLHKNSLNCAANVIRNEGFLKLYSGLGTQLIGVAPEKAIKLTVNDMIYRMTYDEEIGDVKFGFQLLAGACAGASQVLFTNPLEMVKVQLQVQGDLNKISKGVQPNKISAFSIIRQLKLPGLYRGSTACLLRDVPFSMIYFPTYTFTKKVVFNEGSSKETTSLSPLQLFASGCIAGMPASYLATPADVIKTRIQVSTRLRDNMYVDVIQTSKKMLREEGFKSFFKGGPARVLRSSPQFGITLCIFDLLKSVLND